MSFDKRNLALPAIIAVAAVITVNAVAGQDGKHPAPIGGSEPHQKITKKNKPIVSSKILQRKSRPTKTVAVIPRPRPKNTMARSKNDAIGQLLRAAEKNEKTATPLKTGFLDEKRIRFVQSGLTKLGFFPGPVDGVFGQKTRDAIKKFESARKIPVTGEISKALIEALLRNASLEPT